MSAAYALVGSLAAMVIWPTPAVVFGATLFTCVVLIVAFVVGAALEPGAHL
ncbi:hypothetical protein RDV84_23240 [Lysobacter yananisis]|uniref:Integral membrane protein n=1 Tax=Lysobacter yananisis TaxID=1003114 RepID=A0ABY9P6Z8_9GAMM|nr:hypothetical protein [Lysobacter yananisis]WMT02842.1 hypothetical protein RDV84_23240 [Lysobacter yananisis]